MAKKPPSSDPPSPPAPSGRPGKGKASDTIRVESDLARMATIIAIRRGISVSELVSPRLREWLAEEYRRTVKEMANEVGDP